MGNIDLEIRNPLTFPASVISIIFDKPYLLTIVTKYKTINRLQISNEFTAARRMESKARLIHECTQRYFRSTPKR